MRERRKRVEVEEGKREWRKREEREECKGH